ncbi:MAG: alpha-glycosidase [Eubacteriales bacterium]|nr:alpha-glycosidase [Eubacteriales bacterium]
MKQRKFDSQAVFTDQTDGYLSLEKDMTVRIRLRTARGNADRVRICVLPETETSPECLAQPVRLPMRGAAGSGRNERFDIYHVRVTPEITGGKGFSYWFELEYGAKEYVHTRRGTDEVTDPQKTPAGAWYYVPDFRVPRWAKGAVMYQIFTDRFANGDPGNDVTTGEYMYYEKPVVHVGNWDVNPAQDDIRNHYGGDLQGIINKLDYLKDLGVEALYLNPVFLSPSNHKYDTQDYEHIDPHFGRIVEDSDASEEMRKEEGISPADPQVSADEQSAYNRQSAEYLARVTSPENLEASDELFAELVRKAHRRGIRVILDGVFNHCGSAHKWMDRDGIYLGRGDYAPGAYQRQNSPYHDYFSYTAEDWPDHPEPECWWDVSTLPKLNYEKSEQLQKEILHIAARWVSPPFSADGWRLDVAADLGHSSQFNHEFWRKFREAVKTANPAALIIAENYCNSSEWLHGYEWDGIMNYEGFMEPVGWFLTGMEKHCEYFREDLIGDPDMFWNGIFLLDQEKIPQAALMVSMNQLSNHDHARFLTRTSLTVGRLGQNGPDGTMLTSEDAGRGVRRAVFREAVLLQMTLPGMPTLYYGDEAGVCGFTDPDNRRTYPWGAEDRDILTFHKELIRIRHENPCLRNGSLVRLTDAQGVLSFGRFDRDGVCIIALNNRDEDYTLRIPVKYAGALGNTMELLAWTDRSGFIMENRPNGTRIAVKEKGNSGTERRRHRFAVRDGCIRITLPAEAAVILREA